MHKKQHIKKIVTFSAVLLILTFFTILHVPKVAAEVTINQLFPSEGAVGSYVSITGLISTENGSYNIFFDTELVKNGSANIYDVSAIFTVPNATSGNHLVTLQDVNTGENSTAYFTIQTEYAIKAIKPPYPKQSQEGANITISAIVTGGDVTTFANVTVEDPANITHSSANITIPIIQNGYGEVNITYPTDFDENPHTFYVGTYNMSLSTVNETLATGSFAVGLTDSTEYNRFQIVHVQAFNYTSNDILKITIIHNDKAVFESTPKNASEPGGIITANWTIPANASIGLYRVSVVNTTTPLKTEKPVPDNQTFSIVSKSYACEIKTLNLENEPVGRIVVEANNTFTFAITANITNEEGFAFFYLEATNYIFTAFLNNSQVGATPIISLNENLTGTSALNISCPLTQIRVTVKDEEGKVLPFIDISANFTYTTRLNTTIQGTVSTETNLTGIGALRNLFTNINYTIEASRFGQVFDTITINLTSTSWFNTTCPTFELIIKVFDRNSSPIYNTQVKVYDWGIGLGGLVGEGNTSVSGEVSFNFTFGKYIVKVYKGSSLLNETNTLLNDQPTNFAVYCKLYNLTLDVSILDYFGQGIANANVTLEREGIVHSSLNTGGSGIAKFTELLGGNYRIFVYIDEKPYKITTLDLQEPKTVIIKIGEIMSIGGFILETSHFITAIFILSLIVVFMLASIYRRHRSSPKKE